MILETAGYTRCDKHSDSFQFIVAVDLRSGTRNMANIEEDLATDSVPDPPRTQLSPDACGGRSSNSESNSSSESVDEGENVKERAQTSKKTSRENQRRSSSSKPRSPFGFPNTPRSGASMIWINNSKSVHVGNTISINVVGQSFSEPRTSKSPSPDSRNVQKSKEVKDTCKSTAVVSLEDLDIVTEHVGSSWTKLGEHLGYSEGQMERFHEDHNKMGLKEVVYQMLLDWKQFKGSEAQVGILCRYLWSSRLYAAADHLATLHIGKAH